MQTLVQTLKRKPTTITITIKTSSISTSIDPSFTIYFLINSCGLSRSAAIAASSKLHLKTTKTPHSVLSLLRSYNFSKSHISSLVSRRPKLLLSSPSSTLKPKLDFFLSLGISDLPSLLSSSPSLLLWSLPNRMLPNLNLLQSLLGSRSAAAAAINKSRSLLTADLRKLLLPKVDTLQQNNVPMPVILKLISMHPRCLLESPTSFSNSITTLKSFGINPQSPIFAHALGVFDKLPERVWQRKLETYRSLGWSKEDVFAAFAKHPYCMSVSDEKITAHVEFLEGKLGWERSYLMANPVVISLSLEKRIVPRCAVLALLVSNKVVKLKNGVRARHLMMGQQWFLDKFVSRFESDVPGVVDAIQGKVEFTGFREIQN
ncbi:mTERF domain-containing protein mitochondrial protein [Dioscorea alata]|uniref:mTERF domain-containing protein mitochondrial protein n=1 Tax=Dioscorea alata TaxID=55571 RepID=A0ACB7V2A8_DIOAL|nr:mTERF domain-containing protein mitochondrial protein [Dioscorea alata]